MLEGIKAKGSLEIVIKYHSRRPGKPMPQIQQTRHVNKHSEREGNRRMSSVWEFCDGLVCHL